MRLTHRLGRRARWGSAAVGVPGGGGGALPSAAWFANWATQTPTDTGSDSTAVQRAKLQDTIASTPKFDVLSSQAEENGTIIPAPLGEGFPQVNVLRVRSVTGTRDGWMEPRVTSLAQLGAGDVRNYRWYFSLWEPHGLSDPNQHPIQDGGSISQANWSMNVENNAAGGLWGLQWTVGDGVDFNNSRWYYGAGQAGKIGLPREVALCMEVQLVMLTSSTFRFHTWLRQVNGTLIAGDSAFNNFNNSVNLASNPTHTIRNIASTSVFLVGNNGISPTQTYPIHFSNQAGFAVVNGLAEGTEIGIHPGIQQEAA